MGGRLSPLFGLHATVIGLVAVVAILLELGRGAALLALFGAWLAVSALELLVSRRPQPAPPAEPEGRAEEEQASQPHAASRLDGSSGDEEPEPLFTTVASRRLPAEEDRTE